MDGDEIKLLLVKYITNQANEHEINEVKRWIRLHPENELYFIELYEAWQNMLYVKPEIIDEERAYESFLANLPGKQQSKLTVKWIKLAAVFLLMLAPAILFLRFYPAKKVTIQQLVAEKGAIKKITLKDGTLVWLNAGSAIKYDAAFGNTNRTVTLEGEAFFDIAHGKNTVPFIVNTKNYTVRDIGTRFNLKAYPNDPFFEATVVNGEVAVQSNKHNNSQEENRIYVKPHQVLKIYYSTSKDIPGEKLISPVLNTFNEVHVSQVDSTKMEVYDGWKEDVLLFDASTLGDIAKVLERRYNVQITLNDDQLRNIEYSGSFKNVPTIDKVLQIIKQNTPISYTIDGKKITITKLTNH